MQSKARILLILLITLFTHGSYALEKINLTIKEKLFLKNNPDIILGSDTGWAPYVIQNKDGSVSGYDADVLALINQISGANFQLKLGQWGDLLNEAEKKKIDGLSTAVINEKFKRHYIFSDPYLTLKKIIFSAKDNPTPFNSIDDLKGKKFGTYKSNSLSNALANSITDVKIIKFESTQALIEGVTTGKADVMLGNAAMFYLLNKMGNPFLRPAIFLSGEPLELVFVIRNDFPEAVSIINKSLQAIGQERLLKLKQKWFENPQQLNNKAEQKAVLTNDDLAYLMLKKEIKVCIDPDWMPFEMFNKNKHIGMSAEYFKLFQKEINIPIRIIKTNSWAQTITFAKKRTCDMISLATKTPQRDKYLNFTQTFIETPVVLATKPNVSFIDDLKYLNTEKIGIVKNYAFNEIIRNQYPNIQVVDVKNAQDGLQKVANGELFGYIDALATIGYLFQTKFVGELKISGKFPEKWKLAIAVRNDDLQLLNIFNKLINNLSLQTKQSIFNRYIAIKYAKRFDYVLFWKVIFFIVVILIFLLFRYRTMLNYNKKISEYLQIIDNNVLISLSDKEGTITNISEALCQLTGYKKEELIGKNHNIFRHQDTKTSTYKKMWSTLLSGNSWQGEIKSRNKDGSYYWANAKISLMFNDNGTLKGYSAIRHDITDKKHLEKLSVTDSLTQIPNRLYIDNQFKAELQRTKRYKSIFSIILIDIDFFKKINDNYGHHTGDQILITIAKLIKNNIRTIDKLGRWGGEEFLIICPETNINQTLQLAEKIRKKINSYDFAAIKSVTCSIGISQSSFGDEYESIFKRADKALYKAKSSGRNKTIKEIKE